MGLIPTPPDDDGHADDRDDDDDDDLLRLPAQPPAALVGEATRQRNILPARKTVQLCTHLFFGNVYFTSTVLLSFVGGA